MSADKSKDKRVNMRELTKYLKSLSPEAQMEITKAIWRRPEVLVNAALELRRIASDPALSAEDRAEANRLVKQYGLDDETLTQEDEP